MKSGPSPSEFVGNGEFLSRAAVQQLVKVSPVMAAAVVQPATAAQANTSPITAMPLPQPHEFTPPEDYSTAQTSVPERFLDTFHNYSLAVFALLFLVIGIAAIKVGGGYWSDQIVAATKPANAIKAAAPTIAGLNLTVPAKDLQAKLQMITNQPATLTVGSQTVPVGADTIRSWLQITASTDKSQDYIRIKAGTIAASLQKLAQQFVKVSANQVTVNESSANVIVVAGHNGTALTNPNSLKVQADQVAKTVMDGKGLNFSTPLQTQTFQSVTPAAFDKLIDVNLTSKQMYVYQNGQLLKQYGVSAGGPATPTPQGEFHIYEKLPVQDMWGYGPGHKYYFQPHVYWINYFTGGDAVHGVYWHPLSWFGAINSSHGCVGVSDANAEWIYNWAPIGTTVITHA